MLRSNLKSRGFSLLEVIIAVGILSTGIITVVQAMAYSSRVAGIASDYVRALSLANDRLQELEFQEKQASPDYKSNLQANGEQGKIKWSYALVEDPVTKLYRLDLAIEWYRRERKETLNLATYLR